MRRLPRERTVPLRARLDPAHPRYTEILAAHDAALAADELGYLDPDTGAFVFTAKTLWERRRCCKTGCRHCPFTKGPRG